MQYQNIVLLSGLMMMIVTKILRLTYITIMDMMKKVILPWCYLQHQIVVIADVRHFVTSSLVNITMMRIAMTTNGRVR